MLPKCKSVAALATESSKKKQNNWTYEEETSKLTRKQTSLGLSKIKIARDLAPWIEVQGVKGQVPDQMKQKIFGFEQKWKVADHKMKLPGEGIPEEQKANMLITQDYVFKIFKHHWCLLPYFDEKAGIRPSLLLSLDRDQMGWTLRRCWRPSHLMHI
ncbi:hypothetical protein DFJ77DRAFT_441050 [Powellomyces hirtus]|nr:hypothetical protein DFJ77DRAFT_441050 [Powellomyces hirtus]